MGVYSSLWNADSWATRGGLDKIDWTNAPFIAKCRNFTRRACTWNGPITISQCAAQTPDELSYAKQGQMNWVRNNFMIYDYCKDTKRFNGQFPGECFKHQFWQRKLNLFVATIPILLLRNCTPFFLQNVVVFVLWKSSLIEEEKTWRVFAKLLS